MKKTGLTSLIIVCIFSCFFFLRGDKKPQKQTVRQSFFLSVPIEFSKQNIPILKIKIEERALKSKLDLGFNGDLAAPKNVITELNSKEFKGTKFVFGFKGDKYSESVYKIPKIEIEHMVFSNPSMLEESEQFVVDTIVLSEGEQLNPERFIRLGWKLFYNFLVYFDLGNSKLTICDSLETLKNKGHDFSSFVKAPLLIDRNMVEFEALASSNSVRCVFDTGCSYNFINTSLAEPFENSSLDSDDVIEVANFCIGDAELGPIKFSKLELKLPIPIQMILGMEFFMKHRVLIDFRDRQVYVCPIR